MTASDEPDDAVGDDGFDEDLDEIEDLDELGDEQFDPESDEDVIEPSIDDELVDEDELDAEDAVIELSLTDVAEDEEADADDEDMPASDLLEDDDDALVRVVEDEDEEVEGLREGEFICQSCYLAKGPSQLADAKRQICVDCI